MIAYLETSVLLKKLFRQQGAAKDWSQWESVTTSELTEVEAFRAVDRLRLTSRIDDERVASLLSQIRAVLERVSFIEINKEILKRAAQPFPTVVRSLDAIHLASALLWNEESAKKAVFLSHDEQLLRAAKAAGLETAD